VKPPPFRWSAPATAAEAVALLAEDPKAKVLAGGQSLIPLLNMRLVAPPHLVDINRVRELDTIEVTGEGVRVGALVRQARLEHDEAAAKACPLLADALPLVAHPVIRNRGTVCGSIAHGDPAAELPAVAAGDRAAAGGAGDVGVLPGGTCRHRDRRRGAVPPARRLRAVRRGGDRRPRHRRGPRRLPGRRPCPAGP
jgi:FAD binding domain in molybdopterin dehydrogenase